MSRASYSTIKFGTDGWRGVIANDFTFPNVWKVTRAIASYLETSYSRDNPVLIAYDTRFLADQFACSSADVLADLGWTVKIVDRDCPTPVIAYNARLLNSAGALMFTASHNPAIYCGIKYIPDYAGPATCDITNAIVVNLENASDRPPSGNNSDKISNFNPKIEYLNFIYSLIDVQKIRTAGVKVIFDALYSTSRGYLDEVLINCNCATKSLHTNRDVLFGGEMPEPKQERLGELATTVKSEQADLGIATDGDGDRFGIVDELGNIVTPNTILLLLARHLIENKGLTGAIARTVATTYLLDNLAAKYGIEVLETPVGFKYIGQKMRETPVLIGGEESGGLSILGHIPEKDGILANMLVIEAIAYSGKPLSQLAEEAINFAGGPSYNHRLDFHLNEECTRTLLNLFKNSPPSEIAGLKVQKISNEDGVKLYLEDGSWLLLRPSGTEPLMRIYQETSSIDKQKQMIEYMKQVMANSK